MEKSEEEASRGPSMESSANKVSLLRDLMVGEKEIQLAPEELASEDMKVREISN